MIDLNISKGKDFFSQRNNRLFAMSSCNTTSMINALSTAGIKYPVKAGIQPEDDLTALTETKEFLDKREALGDWAEAIPPRQIHALLAEATNKFVGKKVVTFRTDVSIQEIVMSIVRGMPVVVSGRFTSYGHIVCVVGFKSKQVKIPAAINEVVMSELEGFYIDDPFGDYFSGYKDTRGNDIFFPLKDFDNITKGYNSNKKFAHMFSDVKEPVVQKAVTTQKATKQITKK